MKTTIISLIIAAFLWFLMFSPLTSSLFNFWVLMSFSGIILILLSLFFNKGFYNNIHFNLKAVVYGILSAIILWFIFWIGNEISSLIFSFTSKQVNLIYDIKTGSNPVFLIFLLVFIIAPAEEIFWRGFIQNKFSERWNSNVGFILTTFFYAIIHIFSLNFILIMAALVAGIFWGLMYKYNSKNLLPLIISHSVWDVLVFIIFPIY